MQLYVISLSSELLLIRTGDMSLNFLLDYLTNPSNVTHVMGHILYRDLVFIGVSQEGDTVITRIESLLCRIIEILNQYFKPLTESAIKSDFDTVYNIIFDSNVVSVNSNLLFQLYPPPSIPTIVKEVKQVISGSVPLSTNSLILGEYEWRNSNVKYSSNQAWFDFTENIKLTSHDAETVGHISGELRVLSNISGNPVVIVSFLNPKLLVDGFNGFHRCVKVERWLKERLITFIPPDGEVTLMNYLYFL